MPGAVSVKQQKKFTPLSGATSNRGRGRSLVELAKLQRQLHIPVCISPRITKKLFLLCT